MFLFGGVSLNLITFWSSDSYDLSRAYVLKCVQLLLVSLVLLCCFPYLLPYVTTVTTKLLNYLSFVLMENFEELSELYFGLERIFNIVTFFVVGKAMIKTSEISFPII